MFDHTHYVPILKSKTAELESLSVLDKNAKSLLTPLIDVQPLPWDEEKDKPDKSVVEHLTPLFEKLPNYWGSDRPIFIDLDWISEFDDVGNGEHPLFFVINNALKNKLILIPVTGMDRPKEYQDAVKMIVRQFGNGLCIRLENEDFENLDILGTELGKFIAELELTINDSDLLLDFKEVSSDQTAYTRIAITSILDQIPNILDWRTLTWAATSFPPNVSKIRPRTLQALDRGEWIIWEGLYQTRGKLERLPTFGDYNINNPEPIVDFDPYTMSVSANLRYTTDGAWIIAKGQSLKKKKAKDQMPEICKALMNHKAYCGQNYSWGDQRQLKLLPNDN